MFLRVKDGLYAGTTREFPSHIGKELLSVGRAENPFAEPAIPAPAKVAEPRGAATSSGHDKGRKKR